MASVTLLSSARDHMRSSGGRVLGRAAAQSSPDISHFLCLEGAGYSDNNTTLPFTTVYTVELSRTQAGHP